MIITLKGADFSASNIGTLSSWRITRSLGTGATYEGVTSVDKGASFSATVTIAEGYELGAAGVTVTMGGNVISAATVNENTITITITEVTGNVVIKVPTVNISTGEEEEPGVPDTPDEPTGPIDLLANVTWTSGKGFVANPNHINNSGYTIATSSVFKYTAIDVSQYVGKTIRYSQADYTASAGGISGYGIGFVSTSDSTLENYKSSVISAVTFPYSLPSGQGTASEATVIVPEGAKLMLFTWYADNNTKYDGWANVYAEVID